MQEHSTVHWNHLSGVTCWGTNFHFGMTIPDIGLVKDGTDCGPEHVCINKKCVSKPIWLEQCSSKTCTMKGVCKLCHCNMIQSSTNAQELYSQLPKTGKDHTKTCSFSMIMILSSVTYDLWATNWICLRVEGETRFHRGVGTCPS